MRKILLSGASGFAGAHVLRHLLANTEAEILCPVTFRHKGLPERIASSICGFPDWEARVSVVHWDMRSPASPQVSARFADVDVIMNLASESHVDRSITDPGSFIRNNTELMVNVLEFARHLPRLRMFLQMSTDEVYGPAAPGTSHREWSPILPSNPYSASKAAQEAVCFSYWRTYGIPLIVTNTMNLIGEMQGGEKFLPKIMRAVLDGKPVTLHVSPSGVSGSRFYLHARNLADAWLTLMKRAVPVFYPDAQLPLRYNIVGEQEITNEEMIKFVAGAMGANPEIVRENFHESRPGHDLRYALDGTLIEREYGWKPPVPLLDSIDRTVRWTMERPEWLA